MPGSEDRGHCRGSAGAAGTPAGAAGRQGRRGGGPGEPASRPGGRAPRARRAPLFLREPPKGLHSGVHGPDLCLQSRRAWAPGPGRPARPQQRVAVGFVTSSRRPRAASRSSTESGAARPGLLQLRAQLGRADPGQADSTWATASASPPRLPVHDRRTAGGQRPGGSTNTRRPLRAGGSPAGRGSGGAGAAHRPHRAATALANALQLAAARSVPRERSLARTERAERRGGRGEERARRGARASGADGLCAKAAGVRSPA